VIHHFSPRASWLKTYAGSIESRLIFVAWKNSQLTTPHTRQITHIHDGPSIPIFRDRSPLPAPTPTPTSASPALNPQPPQQPPSMSQTPIIAELQAANKVWRDGILQKDPGFFKRSADTKQAPGILWIGCADSRVPESVVLAQLPGQLFVHRNIAKYAPFSLSLDSTSNQRFCLSQPIPPQ